MERVKIIPVSQVEDSAASRIQVQELRDGIRSLVHVDHPELDGVEVRVLSFGGGLDGQPVESDGRPLGPLLQPDLLPSVEGLDAGVAGRENERHREQYLQTHIHFRDSPDGETDHTALSEFPGRTESVFPGSVRADGNMFSERSRDANCVDFDVHEESSQLRSSRKRARETPRKKPRPISP